MFIRYLNFFCLFSGLLFSSLVQSHESRPILIEVNELAASQIQGQAQGQTQAKGSYQYNVSWRVPSSVPDYTVPRVVMPEHCRGRVFQANNPAMKYNGKQIYRCEQSVSGQLIRLQFPVINPSVTSLFRVNLLNGEKHSHLLKPGVEEWRVPEQEDPWQIAKEYTVLGMQHIWEGIDHLLFVACLIFIARTPRRILITITGFTVAHSLTLVVSTLGWVRVAVPPVEASIALSIVFLAHEIAVNHRGSWTYRFPVIVSSSFGLLHGFGFAAVLNDLGLPQTELGIALLFFNVGVEIGQIVFIAALLLLFILFKKLVSMISFEQTSYTLFMLQKPASYVIGCLASFWLLERLSAF